MDTDCMEQPIRNVDLQVEYEKFWPTQQFVSIVPIVVTVT